MKKLIISILSLTFLISVSSKAAEKLSIEKQLVGIVGAISGTVKTETRELKAGDKIYLNETIYAGAGSGTQILLLDQSTFTVGEDSEVVMDTFIFDPATNDGKIVASVKQGSLKVISGLISKKNPDSLTVEVPEGTLGSRGTEFQTIVSKGCCLYGAIISKKVNKNSDIILHSEKEEFFVPKVGILTYFVKAPFARRVALNRENIFIRDFFTCQYCGKSAESVDHIVPRSKGGLHEWSNVVACCKKCNLIKADKLLHQTHLNLKNPPSSPKDNFWIKTIVGSNPDPSWKEYLISA